MPWDMCPKSGNKTKYNFIRPKIDWAKVSSILAGTYHALG